MQNLPLEAHRTDRVLRDTPHVFNDYRYIQPNTGELESVNHEHNLHCLEDAVIGTTTSY